MKQQLPVQRVEVGFVGVLPVGQIDRASGASDVELEGSVLRCLVRGRFESFLQALRGHEVVSPNPPPVTTVGGIQ